MRADDTVASAVESGQWDRVIDYVNREVFDKPDEYYTLDKLRKAAAVDRRLTLREILEKVFGLIPRFKSKDELLEEEFSKFVAETKPDEAAGRPKSVCPTSRRLSGQRRRPHQLASMARCSDPGAPWQPARRQAARSQPAAQRSRASAPRSRAAALQRRRCLSAGPLGWRLVALGPCQETRRPSSHLGSMTAGCQGGVKARPAQRLPRGLGR